MRGDSSHGGLDKPIFIFLYTLDTIANHAQKLIGWSKAYLRIVPDADEGVRKALQALSGGLATEISRQTIHFFLRSNYPMFLQNATLFGNLIKSLNSFAPKLKFVMEEGVGVKDGAKPLLQTICRDFEDK